MVKFVSGIIMDECRMLIYSLQESKNRFFAKSLTCVWFPVLREESSGLKHYNDCIFLSVMSDRIKFSTILAQCKTFLIPENYREGRVEMPPALF